MVYKLYRLTQTVSTSLHTIYADISGIPGNAQLPFFDSEAPFLTWAQIDVPSAPGEIGKSKIPSNFQAFSFDLRAPILTLTTYPLQPLLPGPARRLPSVPEDTWVLCVLSF